MRTYPIAFPYSFTELDEIAISVPQGYTLENAAHPYQMKLYYATYQAASSFENNQLKSKRVLSFKGVHFGAEQYSQFKGFFNVVQGGDGGPALLQQNPATNSQKPH